MLNDMLKGFLVCLVNWTGFFFLLYVFFYRMLFITHPIQDITEKDAE